LKKILNFGIKLFLTGSLFLGLNGIINGQKVPENYSKTDTIVSNYETKIMFYDSLDALIYEKSKIVDGGKRETFYEYTLKNHKKKKVFDKSYDSNGIITYITYLYLHYDKKEENEILTKQYSYSKKFKPEIIVIKKKKYRGNKLKKLKKEITYFSTNEKRKIEIKYNYLDETNIEEKAKVRKFDLNGKRKDKKKFEVINQKENN